MTSTSLSRRLALLAAALASTLVLVSCGGGGGNDGPGSTNLRAINLTTDLASVDLFTGDTRRFQGLAPDTMSARQSFDAGNISLGVRRADGTSLFSESFSLARDRNYTALVTGREAQLLVRALPEDEDEGQIASGKTRVRLFNLTGDTSGVDVFITAANVDIGDTAPTARLTSNTLGDFRELDRGTYRLRVTSVGIPNDVRLDLPVTLADRKYATLVLTSGPGGSLVNATLVEQRGPATALKNTKARVRFAAGVDGNGNVSASINNATVVGSLRSPSLNSYALVDSGSQDLTVRVNGVNARTGAFNFAPGADYTVVVYGPAGAAIVPDPIADDNRLPSTSSRAKLRLINAVGGSQRLTMQLDFLPLATDIAVGSASSYATATSLGSTRLDVTSPTAVDPVFTITAQSGQPLLQAQGVYTVFMLGGQPQPTGILRRDR